MLGAREDGTGTAGSTFADDSVRREVVGRLSTAGALRSALRGHGLSIAYQPIISLTSGRIAALEAFARWTTSTGTSVSPEVFIPVAEENGLIVELGSQILAMAARDAATWQSIAPTGLPALAPVGPVAPGPPPGTGGAPGPPARAEIIA